MILYIVSILISVFYLFLILFAIRGIVKNEKLSIDKSLNKNFFLSVIIPFKNEKNNLKFICQDIGNQHIKKNNYEIIFVDDYSEDNSVEIIKKSLKDIPYRILKNNGSGKKAAITTGVSNAKGEIIITTDADCRLPEKWLSTIVDFFRHTDFDMCIMPVVFKETHKIFSFTNFQALEFLSLAASTAGYTGIKSPIMCNGANLAYKKSAFLKYQDALFSKVESGDDTFLMFKIKKEDQHKIAYLQSKKVIVKTKASENFKEFVNQRIRWTSKTKYYDDAFTKVVGIGVLLINLLIITLLFLGEFKLLLISFLAKSSADFAILWKFSKFTNQQRLMWLFLPLSIIYPFYILATIFCSFFCKYKWK